jgi:signal transduction histidine kinase
MSQRAWSLPRGTVAIAAFICFAQSTQMLFQRTLYRDWSATEIAGAWLVGFGDLATIAASVLLALMLGGRVRTRHAYLRAVLFATAVLFGAVVGEWLVLWRQWGAWPVVPHEVVLLRAFRWLPIGLVSGAIILVRQRARETAARLHESEVTRLQLEQQRVATELQVLQSQIEPHFLFNTLATIRRLYQTDLARGRSTLADFIHYLKSALPEMRASETTLGREVDLIVAYLDVLRVRMGNRLEFEIDVAPSLRGHLIPPLSLATLVENSIKHGLGPLPEGGRVSVCAWVDGNALLVRVTDTGVGIRASGGTGTGLANLRVRLRGLYGDAGQLMLGPNDPRGLVATLSLPVHGTRPARSHGRG